MSTQGADWEEELQALAAREGTLKPEVVVDAARDPSSKLHAHFEWDDTAAAREFRLVQAGALIRRARVTITPRDGGPAVNVRAYVSLSADRGRDGYRSVETVLASPALTSELLAEALRELAAFKRKFQSLSELVGVLSEVDRLLAGSADNAQHNLREAVDLAGRLERSGGMDRVTAAERAAAAFRVPSSSIVEAMRKAS